MRLFPAALAVTVALTVAACGSGTLDKAGHTVVDRQTCADFVQLESDVRAGILTPGEQRTRVQSIDSESDAVGVPAIHTDAQALLAADTTGDTTAEAAALTRLQDDCDW